YDNMKTVVLKHSPIEIRFNRTFEDFLAYYGIVPKACRPKRPQTKGKVERVVKYLKDNFFQRKHEPTLYALNEAVRIWLDQVANRKRIKRRINRQFNVLNRNRSSFKHGESN